MLFQRELWLTTTLKIWSKQIESDLLVKVDSFLAYTYSQRIRTLALFIINVFKPALKQGFRGKAGSRIADGASRQLRLEGLLVQFGGARRDR